MAFNGAGVFVRLFSWTSDAANGINITSSRVDSETDGIAAGLSNCITRDGQGKPTAAIDFNGQNLTNVNQLSASNALGNTYIPTGAIVANVTALTPKKCQYSRMGNIVTFSGAATVTATSASTLTQFSLTLPIASALTAASDVAGSGLTLLPGSAIQVGSGMAVVADVTNDVAFCQFTSGTTLGAFDYYFIAQYEVK